MNKFHSYSELKEAIENYINFYNNERLQERFNDMTPMEIRALALNTAVEPIQYPIKKNKRIQKYYLNLMNKQHSYAIA